MTVRWVRVGRWLLAKTPIHGPRVYRLPTKEEAERMLDTSWAPTDFELWGGHPNEILTDYPGKPLPGGEPIRRNPRSGWKAPRADLRDELPPGAGSLAGLASEHDLKLSDWDMERDGPPNHGWSVTSLPPVADHYTFSATELVARFHETKGQAVIVCGYCGGRLKSRDIQKLLRWSRTHACISLYKCKP
jgi:hypothetical protein